MHGMAVSRYFTRASLAFLIPSAAPSRDRERHASQASLAAVTDKSFLLHH